VRAQAAKVLRSRRAAGLSLVEMLIALAITALLLTATMVATDASFKAYAAAAETASAQTATRMVVNRLLTLIRTSEAVAPAGDFDDPGIDYSGNEYESDYMEIATPDGEFLRIEFVPDEDDQTRGRLMITRDPDNDDSVAQPLLDGVRNCTFHLVRYQDSFGTWRVRRGTLDFSVAPDEDNTLAIEANDREDIRVIASTMPRKR
jgi:Tfp pilus assembly protein PilE